MKSLDIHEVGEIIRKVRKERGLRLEDLADDNISPATISNIERGVSHVKMEKVYYLLEKLDISLGRLPELLLNERNEQKEIKFRLTAIESLSRMGQHERGLELLKEFHLPDEHLYAATYHWVKGTCYVGGQDLKRAEREFYTAIRLSGKNETSKIDNIEAYSFNMLGLCSFYRNNLEQAVKFTDSGLDAFHPEGEKSVVKYFLLRNKAIYLQRLGRIAESLRIVQDVWEELPKVTDMETRFTFYWLRAELLRESSDLEEATKYALEGIQLAGMNRNYNSSLVLWSVLGSIYIAQEKWEKAETCFQTGMSLPQDRVRDRSIIGACTQLGILYTHQERWSEGEDLLNQAIQRAEQTNNYVDQTDALLALARLFYEQDRREEAIPCNQRVVDLARKYHLREKEHEAWYQLAQSWKGVDEQEFQRCTVNMFKIQEKLNQNKAGDLSEVR